MKKKNIKNITFDSIENFIGNNNIIEQLNIIFKKKSEQIIYIKGTYGTGKTLISKLLFNKYNYDVHHIYLSNNKTKKYVVDFLENIENSSNIASFFTTKENKFGLIIDELEVLNANEQHIIKIFIDYFKNTNTPIIFISDNLCNSNIDKLLKNNCHSFEIEIPSYNELYNFVKKNYNNLIIKKDYIKYISQHYHYDIRKILFILNEIFLKSGNDSIDKKFINNILEVNDTYNLNTEIKNTINIIFENEMSAEEIIYQYSKKKILLCDFIMYNAIDFINLYCKKYDKAIYSLEKMGTYYLDIINFDENFYFYDSEIIIQYSGFLFYYMIYNLFLNIKKRKRTYNIKYPLNNIKKYHFYKKKNSLAILQKETTLNIENIINIKKILIHLIDNNNFDEIYKILKNFNISYKNFLLIINFDKEIKLNNKIKKKLSNMLYE